MSQLRAMVVVCVVSAGCGPVNPPELLLPVGTGGGIVGIGGGGEAGGVGGTSELDAGTGGGMGGSGGAGGGSAGGSGGGGTAVVAMSFVADVMPVLKAKCVGCHSGQYEQAATTLMRLKTNTGAAGACANTPRIEVNNGANSLIVKKLLGTAGCGAVMPLVKVGTTTVACTGAECVAAPDIEKVKLWIDQGALDN